MTTTAGYRAIGSDAMPAKPAVTATSAASDGGRLEAVARAAAGAKDSVAQALGGPMPDVNLYTEPLDPAAALGPRDRVQLVLESCRPWGEVLDVRAFNLPAAAELKLRVGHNMETFFYNYIVVAVAVLVVLAIFHPVAALLLAAVLAIAAVFYVVFPEDIRVTDSFSVTGPLKHVLTAAVVLAALTVGGVASLLFAVACFTLPAVLLHALLREHAGAPVESV